ncbi:uncharacterized protein LOC100213518 isoform X1 [Hydra vulgaris]|uniref:uncharacterized protein LOC100213518 isoform X1 n=1 Tax=Hydra vulgaris TaxID=6087 RepID=UPI001F5E7C31|nr:uncharacterized protein LOC100213518 [Hydra vulgaris]
MNVGKPKTVKVIVYSSRNLKSKKGDGEPLAWAVFGFGKDKCCTSQVRDRNAKWNEESTFTLPENNKFSLKINVKDKDDIIGQIIIPIREIPSEEHFLKWVSLGPHKKNSNPQGELCIDCWVEDFYDIDESMNANSNSKNIINKTINRLKGRSPDPMRKFRSEEENRRISMTPGSVSIKGSVSVEDISNSRLRKKSVVKDALVSQMFFDSNQNNSNIADDPKISKLYMDKRYSMADTNNQLPVIKEQCYPPKVLNVVPSSGPSKGGTLIQITGKYLGLSRDDIVRLTVAGCNCLSTLEYYTSRKIMCLTSASHGTGPISIQTKSGGMSASKMMFEFIENNEDDGHTESTANGLGSGQSSNSGSPKAERLSGDLKLKQTVEQLKFENRELREYIDKLVVYLMDKYPDALESSKMYR